MKHLDLFSGIGGFALAAQWCWADRHEVVAFCEQDPWARRILAKHWPGVPCISDIRNFPGTPVYASDVGICGLCGEPYCGDHEKHYSDCECLGPDQIERFYDIDLLTAGWPCQDNSNANQSSTRCTGLDGERSGLWHELIRVMGETKPRWAVLENVSNVLRVNKGRDWGRCLRDLAQIGYDAEWECLRASQFGAPHHRERVFVVAHPSGNRSQADESIFSLLRPTERKAQCRVSTGTTVMVGGDWSSKPPVCGVDDGVPNRTHRARGLGNAIVPQVAFHLMTAIRQVDKPIS